MEQRTQIDRPLPDIPVGTSVTYYPFREDDGTLFGDPFKTTTRSNPYYSSCGDAVVFLVNKVDFSSVLPYHSMLNFVSILAV